MYRFSFQPSERHNRGSSIDEQKVQPGCCQCGSCFHSYFRAPGTKFDREGEEHSCLRVVGCESELVGAKEVPLCCHIRAAAANQQWACPGTQELANHDANRKDASTLYALAGWSSKDETIRKKTTNWISTRSKHHVYSINQNHSKSIKIYHDLSGPKPRPIESNWSLLVGCWFLCHHRRPALQRHQADPCESHQATDTSWSPGLR